jgi:CRP-like cAMP-binding protein
MSSSTNLILASLSSADAAALKPHLRSEYLKQKRILYDAGDTIDTVYFPTSGIVSIVVALSTGETIEAAMIGKDGVVGAAAGLDARLSMSRAVVQLSGDTISCPIGVLKTAALQSNSFLSKLVRHEQMLFVQAQQSTACMAAHDVEARLCRWLLRARDLSGNDTLMFTQEYLADMLGVRRTSVTLVAHTLQRAGFIKYVRGKIELLDIAALIDTACECYETVKTQHRLLAG